MDLLILLLLSAALILLYLYMISPSLSRKKETLRFAEYSYAHRGLWDLSAGIPENSLPAFRRAAEQGYAIELDVHLTKDGQLVVFHDEKLGRICGVPGNVEHSTWEELKKLRLSGTMHHMPLFAEVLRTVGGRVPLLIELKLPDARDMSLLPVLMDALQDYPGEYIIESFNPFGILWLKKNAPQVIRGILSDTYKKGAGPSALMKRLSTALLFNGIIRPDFIAYNFRHADRLGLTVCRKLFKTPVFAWTVRTPQEYAANAGLYAAQIFERFRP